MTSATTAQISAVINTAYARANNNPNSRRAVTVSSTILPASGKRVEQIFKPSKKFRERNAFWKVPLSLLSTRRVGAPSVQFDGNDWMACSDDASLWSQSLTKFSFSFWVFVDAVTETMIVNHGNFNGYAFACWFYPNENKITFFMENSTGSVAFLARDFKNLAHQWHHITCVYDNSLGSLNVKIYIDTELAPTTGEDSFTDTINLSASLDLGGSFIGNIKDFRWWTTKALTQTEVNQIRDNNGNAPRPDYWLQMLEGSGNPVDSISGTKVGTLNGATWSPSNVPDPWSGQVFSHKYNIRKLVTKTFTHKWDIKKLISKVLTHKYSIRLRLGQVFTHKYNLRKLVTKVFTHKWSMKKLVTGLFTHKWNMRKLISRVLTHKYNIRKLVTKTFTHIYVIRKLVTKAFTHKYNILKLITRSLTHKYNIRLRVQKVLTHKYSIRLLITKAFTHKYNMKKLITRVFTHKWDIRKLITRTFTHKWNMTKLITRTFIHKYNIRKLVTKTFTHIYDILVSGLVTVSAIFTHKYAIRKLATQTYTHKYNQRKLVTRAFTHKWNMSKLVTRLFTYKYNITQVIQKVFTHKYNIRHLTTRTFTYKYVMRKLVTRVFTHKWSMKKLITRVLTHRYDIRKTVGAITFTYKYSIRELATRTFTHKYHIFKLITKVFTHIYNIPSRLGKTTDTDIALLITRWLKDSWTNDPYSTVEFYLIPPKDKITFGSRFDLTAGSHSDMHVHVRSVHENPEFINTDATLQSNSDIMSIHVEVRWIPDAPLWTSDSPAPPSRMMWQIRAYMDELIRSSPMQLDSLGIEAISLIQVVADSNTPPDVHAQSAIEQLYTIIFTVKVYYAFRIERVA